MLTGAALVGAAGVLINWLDFHAAPRRRRSRPATAGRSAKRASAIIAAGPVFCVHAPAG
jgi:hypothetical protein